MAATPSPIIPELAIIRAQGEGDQRATVFELFFDLVYVFAVTPAVAPSACGHQLVGRDRNGVHARRRVLGVELHDVDDQLVRPGHGAGPARMVFVMAASLLMAVAIPEGFDEYALLFACAYSGLQIGRNAFVAVVTPRGLFNQNFRQILAGACSRRRFGSSAASLMRRRCAGFCGWVPSDFDLAAPLVRYWLPGVGATAMSQWQIESAHFGDMRCAGAPTAGTRSASHPRGGW